MLIKYIIELGLILEQKHFFSTRWRVVLRVVKFFASKDILLDVILRFFRIQCNERAYKIIIVEIFLLSTPPFHIFVSIIVCFI